MPRRRIAPSEQLPSARAGTLEPERAAVLRQRDHLCRRQRAVVLRPGWLAAPAADGGHVALEQAFAAAIEGADASLPGDEVDVADEAGGAGPVGMLLRLSGARERD